MNRRKFIQAASIVTTGFAVSPQLIAASSGAEKKQLILLILSGGLRLQDAMDATNMSMFFAQENSIIQKGAFFNKVYYSGTEITHSHAKYAILNASNKIDIDFLNQSATSKIQTNYTYLNYDIKHTHKLLNSFDNALSIDRSTFNVINLDGADVAHYNFSQYVDYLKKVDHFINTLYKKVTESKNNITLFIVSEHGRNNSYNPMGGLDHYQPEARNTFAWLTNNKKAIKQGVIIDEQADLTEVMLFCEKIVNQQSNKATSTIFDLALI